MTHSMNLMITLCTGVSQNPKRKWNSNSSNLFRSAEHQHLELDETCSKSGTFDLFERINQAGVDIALLINSSSR
jgi:hypothetical protein